MAKLSSRNLTTTTTDGIIHIILPDGIGGYESWGINYNNFIKSVQDQIDTIESIIGTKRTDLNKSASFDFELPANVKLISFDIQQISGTVTIKIGTTLGGEDILPEYSFSSGIESISLSKVYSSLTTIYVTRISGTFNLVTLYNLNWI